MAQVNSLYDLMKLSAIMTDPETAAFTSSSAAMQGERPLFSSDRSSGRENLGGLAQLLGAEHDMGQNPMVQGMVPQLTEAQQSPFEDSAKSIDELMATTLGNRVILDRILRDFATRPRI